MHHTMPLGALVAATLAPGAPSSDAIALWSGLFVVLLAASGNVWVMAVVRENQGALEHPARRRIYEHLLRLPGDHFRSIARSLGMNLGTLRYHMGALVRLGLVRRQDVNGKARYYPLGRAVEADMNLLYQQHWGYRDLRMRVLFAARRMQSVGPTDVGRALGISRQLAAYHLACLEEAGYLRREGGRYHALPPLAKERRK